MTSDTPRITWAQNKVGKKGERPNHDCASVPSHSEAKNKKGAFLIIDNFSVRTKLLVLKALLTTCYIEN